MVNLQHFSRLSSLVLHLWQTWVLAPIRICTNILIRMHAFLGKIYLYNTCLQFNSVEN